MGISRIPMPGNFIDAMLKGTQIGSNIVDPMMQRKIKEKELEQASIANQNLNDYRMGQLDIEKQMMPGKMALDRAHANYYGAQADPRLLEANIQSQQALAKQRQMGLGMGGVGQKEEMFFQNLVARDNPQLGNDPEKVYEAANALREGRTSLQDGTPLRPLSPASKASFNRIAKGETTSALINQNIQAQQAEAELPIYDKAISKGVQHYGTTVMGVSPKQIADAINVKDHKAQERLGEYLAAQQLLYDRAALTLRINSLPAGVRIADEIKNLSFQSVNAKFPMFSAEARKIAAEKVASALREGLEARQSVDIGAAQAKGGMTKGHQEGSTQPIAVVYKNGKEYRIPPNLLQKALKEGFSSAE
jgi:hypothetical protein